MRLQFLSLPSGIVKDCHRAQKLAKESEQERNDGGNGGPEDSPLRRTEPRGSSVASFSGGN